MGELITTPKFLSPEMVQTVIVDMLGLVLKDSFLRHKFEQNRSCHVVVLVPELSITAKKEWDWATYATRPHLLAEHSEGDKSEWKYPFDNIARSKALQLWQDRNDDRTDIMPHLLFPGDTPYWGGVKRDGIVVTVSGFQEYFDKMVAGMIADVIIGMAYHEWVISRSRREQENFLI